MSEQNTPQTRRGRAAKATAATTAVEPEMTEEETVSYTHLTLPTNREV